MVRTHTSDVDIYREWMRSKITKSDGILGVYYRLPWTPLDFEGIVGTIPLCIRLGPLPHESYMEIQRIQEMIHEWTIERIKWSFARTKDW